MAPDTTPTPAPSISLGLRTIHPHAPQQSVQSYAYFVLLFHIIFIWGYKFSPESMNQRMAGSCIYF